MDALVPAFLAALLTQLSDRPAWLTAILADRYGRPLTVALAAGLAHAAGNGLAALGGAMVAPMLTPNAQALLLGLALIFGGIGAIWPVRMPDRLERWRLGPMLTPLLGVFILAFGGQTQFFTLAIAARGMPEFAAAGAALGAFGVAFIAAVLGELAWCRRNLRWLRIGMAALFLVSGIWLGLGALRLL